MASGGGMRTTLLTFLMLVAPLLGCSSADKADEDREGVFDPMVETIDRAKEVEDAALKHKEEIDARLKELEGNEENDE